MKLGSMRKHNYVCGYPGENQVIYGNDNGHTLTGKNWTHPMTLFQAKQYVKKINKRINQGMVVFKIVEIKL